MANPVIDMSSPPASDQAPVKTLGADMTKSLDAGGTIFSQGLTAGRVTEPGTNPSTGDDTNISSNAKGKTSGFPDAGGGDGTGMTKGKQGTVIGQTKAKPRTPFNPALYGGKK